MVPEGAEDNVDALQRAAERLEADAARTRRDLLVAASRVLGDPAGPHYVSVADSDARDARVVAALMDIVPRGTEEPTKRPSFVADARENGTSRSGATSGSGAGAAAQPAWAAMSDSATREEDTALSDAAAALCEARSRRDVAPALAARENRRASRRPCGARRRLRRGDFAGKRRRRRGGGGGGGPAAHARGTPRRDWDPRGTSSGA